MTNRDWNLKAGEIVSIYLDWPLQSSFEKWLNNNCVGSWNRRLGVDSSTYYFSNEQDAVVFKLRFG